MDRRDDSFDRDIGDLEPADLDLEDAEGPLRSLHEDFSTETLIAAYHSIAASWNAESLTVGQGIPNLLPRASQRALD